MKHRKIWALALTAAMVLGSFTIASAASGDNLTAVNSAVPVSAFSDVKDHWAAPAIDQWSGRGVINGFEGLFRPDDAITRGEMAVILDNMMDYQVTVDNTFYDVAPGQFYTEAVLKANASGILLGNGVALRPTDYITREEAAVILSRTFSVNGAATEASFDDATAISTWAKAQISAMQVKGYIEGFNNYFRPQANVSRAEMLTIINNIVKAYYTIPGTYTENVVGTAVIKVPNVILKDLTVSGNLIVAEGVAKGDATFDSVTILGDLVIRGGGENSIHIIGDAATNSIRIEKIGDRVRIVIGDGLTVQEMEVSAGEEIIISGNVGILDISAPGVLINVDDAKIKTAIVSGEGSSIVVGEGSTIESIAASAKVMISGAGDVGQVTLYAGADGSGITTANTEITVAVGVEEVTGGGGTAIPAGSTGTNDASGDGMGVIEEPVIGGGGGGGILPPTLTLGTIAGATSTGENSYTVLAAVIEDVSVTVTAANYITDTNVTISVQEDKVGGITQWATVTLSAAALNGSHTTTVGNLYVFKGALELIDGNNTEDTALDYAEELTVIKAGDRFIVEITAGIKKISFTIVVE